MELPDTFRDHLRRAQRAIALCRLTEIHGVTNAEGFGRAVQCFLVAVVQAGEQQMAGAEGDRAAIGAFGGFVDDPQG